jgi:hypothetical protein
VSTHWLCGFFPVNDMPPKAPFEDRHSLMTWCTQHYGRHLVAADAETLIFANGVTGFWDSRDNFVVKSPRDQVQALAGKVAFAEREVELAEEERERAENALIAQGHRAAASGSGAVPAAAEVTAVLAGHDRHVDQAKRRCRRARAAYQRERWPNQATPAEVKAITAWQEQRKQALAAEAGRLKALITERQTLRQQGLDSVNGNGHAGGDERPRVRVGPLRPPPPEG